MFVLEHVVIEESGCKLFRDLSYWFPVGWAEIIAKSESALYKEDGFDNKGEGPHDIGVMFEMSEA